MAAPRPRRVLHFASGEAFRAWLERNHAAAELWVGFWRKDSGKGGITYPEALDEALCWGWIDGVRVKVTAESYANRFTPRKARSAWSAVNLQRYEALLREGRVSPPGYRRVAASWVMDAKQEETRWRRLGVLVEDSRSGRRLALVTGARRPPRRRGGTSSPAPSSGGSRPRRRS